MFDLNDCKIQMLETVQAHESELKNIRTGRVSPDILKTIIVDSYGSKMPLTQLANINNLDNMTLSVSIWDSSLVKGVEKSILESNLGVTSQTDGNNLLLKFPELTSERRKDLVKIINEISEKFKISIRNIRRKFMDIVKNEKKDKSISLDESKKFNEDIQKLTDDFISQIDKNSSNKESEIIHI